MSVQWFDGYDGQDILLLDDFAADQVPFQDLLRWCDIYRITLQVKGAIAHAAWRYVIITSNFTPEACFSNYTNCDPLLRRITLTHHCKDFDNGQPVWATAELDYKTLIPLPTPQPFVDPPIVEMDVSITSPDVIDLTCDEDDAEILDATLVLPDRPLTPPHLKPVDPMLGPTEFDEAGVGLHNSSGTNDSKLGYMGSGGFEIDNTLLDPDEQHANIGISDLYAAEETNESSTTEQQEQDEYDDAYDAMQQQSLQYLGWLDAQPPRPGMSYQFMR